MRERVVEVDFGRITEAVLCLTDGTPEELRRAEAARNLVAAVSEERGAPELTAAYLMGLDENAFGDARSMVDGDPVEATLRAALEAVDPESWDVLFCRVLRLEASPDPSIAPQFV